MSNVIAAVDLSDVTGAVTAQAAGLARALGAKLWLVHMTEPEPAFIGYDAGPQVVREQTAEHLRAEHRRLEALVEPLRGQELDVEALLLQGPAAYTLVEQAERLEADLIVLGSHGHGQLYKALVGSVTEEVLRHSPCPVVVVPARKRS